MTTYSAGDLGKSAVMIRRAATDGESHLDGWQEPRNVALCFNMLAK